MPSKRINESLPEWIRRLEKEGKLYSFYKSPQWQRLRAEVLREQHGECQRCKARGKISRAVLVHHVNEVRKRPDLALSKTYTDYKGDEHKQLIALCFACHEDEHKRLEEWQYEQSKDKFTNEERY